MASKHTATLRYPPDYDGELHIKVVVEAGASTFEHATVTMTVAMRKTETVRDLLRRVGRELASQPLSVSSRSE